MSLDRLAVRLRSIVGEDGVADDAGTACLKHMLEWSLRHDAESPDEGCGGDCTCKGS